MEQISRKQSVDEQKDYKALGNKSVKQIFLKQLSEVGYKFVKEHKPFDKQCAILDFQDKIDSIEKENERSFGFVKKESMDKLDFGDLSKYGDMSRFEKLEDDEEVEMQNINGVRTAVKIGHTIKYRCKNRGHKCSVFYPEVVYQERFGKGGK